MNGLYEAGVSVRGRTIPEDGLDVEDYEEYLVQWPGRGVRAVRKRK